MAFTQGFKSAKILVSVIFIIIVIGNVSLYQIAVNLEGHGTKHDSKERAIRRLLDKTICPKIYAQLIDKLLNFSKMSNLELIMLNT